MKVRFLDAYTVKAVDGPSYKKGQVVDVGELSAQHFLNRQVAVEVDGAPEQTRVAAPETAVMPQGRPRKMKDALADKAGAVE